MKISIVTPSYNQAAFIEQTICSVLDQDYPDIEYWVMDGGSNDGSVEIIRKYGGRLAGWVSEKDKGQADAINKGLARASGDILAWINSDDVYCPDTFQSVVKAFQQNPGAVLAYGDVISLNEAGQEINRQRYQPWNLQDLTHFRILGQPSVFFKREALLKAGLLDENYHYLLDHHLWLRIVKYGEMVYVPQAWSKARFHTEAKNVALAADFGRDAYRIVEWMQTDPDWKQVFMNDRRRIMAGAHWFNARYFSAGGQAARSLKTYWKSFRLDPAPVLRDWKRLLGTFLMLAGIDVFRKF